jgi:hypothetical protein
MVVAGALGGASCEKRGMVAGVDRRRPRSNAQRPGHASGCCQWTDAAPVQISRALRCCTLHIAIAIATATQPLRGWNPAAGHAARALHSPLPASPALRKKIQELVLIT